MVHLDLVFAITLRGKDSFSAVRKAQKDFEAETGSPLDLASTWIGFGERAVVLNQKENRVEMMQCSRRMSCSAAM